MVVANSAQLPNGGHTVKPQIVCGSSLLLVIVSGLALGGLYGMTALVYNVMYSTSKVLSFGTGQFAMAGGICAALLVLNLHLPLWVGFAACLLSGGVFGWLREIIAVRRIVAVSDEHLWVLSTLALSTMVQEAMGHVVGHRPDAVSARLPAEFAGASTRNSGCRSITAVAHGAGPRTVLPPLDARQTLHRNLRGRFAARARGVATDQMRALSYVLAGCSAPCAVSPPAN